MSCARPPHSLHTTRHARPVLQPDHWARIGQIQPGSRVRQGRCVGLVRFLRVALTFNITAGDSDLPKQTDSAITTCAFERSLALPRHSQP